MCLWSSSLVSTYAGPGSILPPAAGFSDYSAWATYTDVSEVTLDWHVPTEEELDAARALLNAVNLQAIRAVASVM